MDQVSSTLKLFLEYLIFFLNLFKISDEKFYIFFWIVAIDKEK